MSLEIETTHRYRSAALNNKQPSTVDVDLDFRILFFCMRRIKHLEFQMNHICFCAMETPDRIGSNV